jgi:hypothetical protein
MLPIFADFWLFGKWIPTGYNPAPSVNVPGDPMKDVFGQTITVGSKVKLIGTVTAIDPMDAHFQDITFVPDYPQSFLVENQQGVSPTQRPIKSVKAHPLQLVVVGSSL